MQACVTVASVVQFLNHCEDVAMKEDFNLLREMIDERAYFRFNDGDFVGRQAIQATLRYVHVRAHLTVARSLRPGQIARYDEFRGYGPTSVPASGDNARLGHGAVMTCDPEARGRWKTRWKAMKVSMKLRPFSAPALAVGGTILMALGLYFVFLRPAFLPENPRSMGTSLREIQAAVPGLSVWLRRGNVRSSSASKTRSPS